MGFWGSLVWLGAFQLGEYLMKINQKDLALTAFGYIMGFITVFAGHLFWGRIVQGRWNELLGDGCINRSVSAITLVIVFAYGIFGLVNGIFNSNPWYYSLTFALGGLVVNQGLMPIIDTFDKGKQSHGVVQ